MCAHASAGTTCPYGTSCEHAHTLAELRADAAIALGVLPEDYKTHLCENMIQSGQCDVLRSATPLSCRTAFLQALWQLAAGMANPKHRCYSQRLLISREALATRLCQSMLAMSCMGRWTWYCCMGLVVSLHHRVQQLDQIG